MAEAISLIHVGLGNIGGTALGMLRADQARWAEEFGIPLTFRSFIDSSGGVACDDDGGYSPATIDRLLAARSSGVKAFEAATGIGLTPRTAEEALEITLSQGPAIVIDCAAGAGTGSLAARAVERGAGAVFSNKAPMSQPGSDPAPKILWSHAGQDGLVRYETTCGAGLPVISTLRSLLDSGDRVLSISGALSGTLGAIFADVAAGIPFSEAVRSAKEIGYTEPDPRDDLSGLDVARKALILARTIGMSIDLDDIAVESLVPADLEKLSIDDFMAGIQVADSEIERAARDASADGKTLKYVASVDPGDGVSVGIRPIANDTVLGSLQGPENIITIRTERYEVYPLTVAGPGAGAAVTAAGVVADVLSLAGRLKEH